MLSVALPAHDVKPPLRLAGKSRTLFERTIIETVKGTDQLVLRVLLDGFFMGKAVC